MPQISRRAESLGTENAFVVLAEVNALAREGRDIVSFCIGQPDFPTPRYVQQAAIVAIKSGSMATRRPRASTNCARPRRKTWANGAASTFGPRTWSLQQAPNRSSVIR